MRCGRRYSSLALHLHFATLQERQVSTVFYILIFKYKWDEYHSISHNNVSIVFHVSPKKIFRTILILKDRVFPLNRLVELSL